MSVPLQNSGLGDIIDIWIYIQISGEYLSYFVDFMEIENHKYDGTLPIEKRDDGEYEFEFKDVSFSYPNSEKPVLDHVSFKLKLKEKMALVGPNGAGKTTFIKLLSRLYDPTEGEILLNGIDIRLYDYDEYIQLFSVVFQDFSIFSFSIAESLMRKRSGIVLPKRVLVRDWRNWTRIFTRICISWRMTVWRFPVGKHRKLPLQGHYIRKPLLS